MDDESAAGSTRRDHRPWVKVAIVVALLGGVCLALYLREAKRPAHATTPSAAVALPRLVDLGATKCIPCRMMAPILEELKAEYAGKLDVEFIDVWENPGAGEQYGVQMIPVQVFYDASGKERFRHQGFFAKEDILAKWKELGVDLGGAAKTASTSSAPAPAPAEETAAEASSVEATYPGLASGVLAHAKVSDLPEGVLLRCGGIEVGPDVLEKEMANAPAAVQEQLKKNAFFVLERLSARPLLLQAAKDAGATVGAVSSKEEEAEAIRSYIDRAVGDVQVSDAELADFYQQNQELIGAAPLESVQDQLREFVQGQKRQEAVDAFVRSLGQRLPIEVQKSWVSEQAVLAKDNPVDKARSSGKPSVVDFGADGCIPCEMMAPVLKTLESKYAGKANVLFVHVRQEQVLASRYGIQSIPVQVFFDSNGREVYRHTGFFSQQDAEKKLAEAGVQ